MDGESMMAEIERRCLEELGAARPAPAHMALTQDEYDRLCVEILESEREAEQSWREVRRASLAADEALNRFSEKRGWPPLEPAVVHEWEDVRRFDPDGPVVGAATVFGFVRISAPDQHPLRITRGEADQCH